MEKTFCNLCGNSEFSVLYDTLPSEEIKTSEKYGTTSSRQMTEKVVKCKSCGLIFVNPLPSEKDVIEGYANADGSEYVSQEKGRMETFHESIRLVKKYSSGGKILDVGAAAGFFLKAAREEGFEPYGVELNKWLVNWGNKQLNLSMKSTTIENAGFEESFFDVVTLWDVLEHVRDPADTLKQINKVTKKNGVLIVNFPNIGSTLAKVAGRKWWFLTSVHLYYFTPETLKKMLEKNGFKTILIKRHYQKLNLGYMLEWHKKQTLSRGGNGKIHDYLISFLKFTRLYNQKIKYYASQTLVIAKKE